MQRKWILISLWGAVAAALIMTAVLFAPQLVARHYIAQIVPVGTMSADHAFRRLHDMGKWAIPALLDAADQRDPVLSDLRQADLCTAILFTHWDTALMSEAQKRRLIRHVYRTTIEVEPGSHSLEGPPIPITIQEASDSYPIGADGYVSLFREGNLLVSTNGGELRPVPQFGEIKGVATHNSQLAWLKNSSFSPTRSIRAGGAVSGSNSVLQPKSLGVGKHEFYVRVSLGLSFNASADPDHRTPPPWYEELTFGPTELEIVDGTTIAQ